MNKDKITSVKWFAQENLLLYIIITFFILFSFIGPGFFTLNNFLVILRSMSIVTVLGLGITFVITAGEIDLSIGSVPAFSAAIFAILLEKNYPLLVGIIGATVIATLIGFVNGKIVATTNLPSIIVTLATNMISSGFAYIITHQAPIVVTNEIFIRLFGGNIFGFPIIVLWMLFLMLISYIILHLTKIGRNLAFIGENRLAAYYAGIKVGDTLVLAFLISSIYSAIAGLLGVAQSFNAAPWMLSEYMMTAIAATIIGGTSFTGGKGNIIGVVLGAFFLTMLSNGFLIIGIPQWVLYLINGIIIITALSWRYLH